MLRNVGHNKDVGKGSTEAKIGLEQALAIGLMLARLTVIVGPLAICVCRKDGADVSTKVDHEAFSGVTLMNVKHEASSRITRRRRRNECLVSPFPAKEQGSGIAWWYQHEPDVLSRRLGCARDRDLGFW